MTIDWTQPVETTEDPSRPVRVLATDAHGAWPVVGMLDGLVHRFTAEGVSNCYNGITLRNVAPPNPEPVLREAWIVWNSEGGRYTPVNSEDDARDLAERVDGVYARAAVMSDGSPVPGEGHTNCWANYNLMTADRDQWRTQCEKWRTKAETLQASLEVARQQRDDASVLIERMKPVVDAAVAYAKADNTFRRHATYVVLHEAVRTYQSPKKTAAEAVANVAAMMGPVKNCTTCRSYVAHPCGDCTPDTKIYWEPSHD